MRYLDSPAAAGSLVMTHVGRHVSDTGVPKQEFRHEWMDYVIRFA